MFTEVSDRRASSDSAAVLTRAVVRAAEWLEISQQRLAKILGLSSNKVSRLRLGSYPLDPRLQEWDHAKLLVRLFRSLNSVVSDIESARIWLNSDNNALDARPIDLLSCTEGLVRVVQYLDASSALVVEARVVLEGVAQSQNRAYSSADEPGEIAS